MSDIFCSARDGVYERVCFETHLKSNKQRLLTSKIILVEHVKF